MPNQSLAMNQEKRVQLRNALLDYFKTHASRPVNRLEQLDAFKGFSREEIRIMVYSMVSVGLIARMNDAKTSAARYGLTVLGRYFVDHRDDLSEG